MEDMILEYCLDEGGMNMACKLFDFEKALEIVKQDENLIWKAERATTCRDPEAWHFICPLCEKKCIIHVCESGDEPMPMVELMCPKNPDWLICVSIEEFNPEDVNPCEHCPEPVFCRDDD